MDEKQLLLAIAQIVDEKTSGLATREDIAELKSRMTSLELSYENKTDQILNLLREDYSRVADAAAKTADYDDVKSQVAEHRSALENHSQRLTELEKKAI